MANFFSISKIRGTMFIPRIPYDWSIVNRLLEKFQGFIPTVYGSPQPDGNVLYTPGDWELRSPDGLKRLIFSTQKIDYIEIGQKDYSQAVIESFSQICSVVFSEIVANHGQMSSRLAIAPSFVCSTPFARVKGFLNNIYIESKMSFAHSELDSCDFSQVFRPIKNIAGTDVSMNFLSKFTTETVVSTNDSARRPIQLVKADFDINTTPNQEVSFDIESIRDFFAKAGTLCEEFYQFYFQD